MASWTEQTNRAATQFEQALAAHLDRLGIEAFSIGYNAARQAIRAVAPGRRGNTNPGRRRRPYRRRHRARTQTRIVLRPVRIPRGANRLARQGRRMIRLLDNPAITITALIVLFLLIRREA